MNAAAREEARLRRIAERTDLPEEIPEGCYVSRGRPVLLGSLALLCAAGAGFLIWAQFIPEELTGVQRIMMGALSVALLYFFYVAVFQAAHRARFWLDSLEEWRLEARPLVGGWRNVERKRFGLDWERGRLVVDIDEVRFRLTRAE